MKTRLERIVAVSLVLAGAASAHICLTTTFGATTSGTANGWVTAFDVTVNAPGGITIDSIDVNSGAGGGATIMIEVYRTPSTYVGKELSPAAWTLVSTGTATAQGQGNPTLFDVADFSLPAGRHGLGIRYVDSILLYTTGNGMNQQYVDANIQIDLGAVIAGPFTGAFVSNRVGNFTLCYDLNPGAGLTPYCVSKTNSLGCTPAISGAGVPSASATSGFDVECGQVRNNKSGLLFYRANGNQAGTPFQCGTLCVGPSGIERTPARSAGGSPAPANDCSGRYHLDMNAFAAGLAGGNPDPALLLSGTVVHCQWWGRDQGFAAPCNTTLSDGGEYTTQP